MPSTDPNRPNVIVILADDLGCWALGCAGNAEIRTPNIDSLAASGTRLTNFFCVSPVCSPARASLLTGRIPSQHGVHDWIRTGNCTAETERGGGVIEYLRGQIGYTDVLAAAGWDCGLCGKWHLGDAHRPQKGFKYWQAHASGGGPYYNWQKIRDGQIVVEPRYVSDVITDDALAFLNAQEGEVDGLAGTEARGETPLGPTGKMPVPQGGTPFYLSVHYTAPHSPWDRDNHPAAIYDDYRVNCPFASVPTDPPHPWQVNSAPLARDPEKRRDTLAGYFAAVTAMDANIGRILDWLDARRMRQSTLVFFTSDNGMNMGHHGLWGKGNASFPMNMYDTSVKVPAIANRPGAVPQGKVCDALVSHYDFMPTLLDYLGLDNPAETVRLPGASFAAVLRGQDLGAPYGDAPRRESVVVYDEYGPVRMIRSKQWKYVHRYPYGPHELYDLAADPDERVNLYGRPEHAECQHDMRARLEGWFTCYVDPLRDGTHEAVTGKGQFGLCGPAANGNDSFADDWHYVGPEGEDRGKTPPIGS